MTIAEMFIAWSAALAMWSWCGAALALHRLWDAREFHTTRDRFIIVGIAAGAIAAGIHQTDSAWLWMGDAYSVGSVRLSTLGYRTFGTIMALCLGGTMAWPRCGHRGWVGLVLIGLAAGVGAVMADRMGLA